MENLNDIYSEIKSDPENAKYSAKNIDPLYYATKNARILIIGQAPGKKAPELASLVIYRRARALPPNGIPVCSAPCRTFN